MVLGEEAEIAICDNCNKSQHIDDGVICEACQEFYCRNRFCWEHHWCGPLTDRNGRIVRMDDALRYISNPNIYVVTEIVPTFTRGRFCVGERRINKNKGDGKRYTMRVRLMELVKE